MTKFLDGPASGVILTLQRVQIMLRVVRDKLTGEWDALNDPADMPKETEEIFVYRMVPGTHVRMHICRSPRRLSGWVEGGEYRLWPEQPGPEHTRTIEAWRAWCDANKPSLMDGFKP